MKNCFLIRLTVFEISASEYKAQKWRSSNFFKFTFWGGKWIGNFLRIPNLKPELRSDFRFRFYYGLKCRFFEISNRHRIRTGSRISILISDSESWENFLWICHPQKLNLKNFISGLVSGCRYLENGKSYQKTIFLNDFLLFYKEHNEKNLYQKYWTMAEITERIDKIQKLT